MSASFAADSLDELRALFESVPEDAAARAAAARQPGMIVGLSIV